MAGIFNGIGGLIKGAVAAVTPSDDTIELTGLMAFGIPEFAATFIQDQRRAFGYKAITNPTYLGIFAICMQMLFAGIIAAIYGIVMWIFKIYTSVLQGKSVSKFQIFVFCATVGFLISLFIYYFFVKPALKKSNIDIAKNVADTMSAIEPFANPSSAPETSLVNLQMLGVKQAAYIGPNESDGSFDTAVGIQSALKAGVRFFTLQIGFLEAKKDSAKFEEPFTPTLLYRDDAGKLISANSGSIKEVAKTLAAYAFADSLLSGSQPIVIYLHFERAPNALREPEKYVRFLSSVADYLQPLQDYMVKNTPSGNYQRQMNESGLINAPIASLEKKALILCNLDTTIFRNLKTIGMEQIDNKYDLDFMVNMRVYLDAKSESLGASDVPHNGEMPNAVVVSSKSILGLSDDDRDAFALKGKSRFVIVMPSQMKNPTFPAINLLLERNSVNCILLNLFGEDIDILKGKMKAWKGEPFYSVKPANYRSSGPNL
jgi:hypothetical protein